MNRFLILLLSFFLSCGSADPTDSELPDSGSGGSTGGNGSTSASLVLGTGETAFAPVTEGQVLALILGPQGTGRLGGYHIWGGLEARGLDASNRVNLKFTLVKKLDGQLMTNSEWNKMLQPAQTGAQFYALPLIVRDCCSARGELLEMRATATDQNGISVTSSVTIQAGSRCSDAEGNDICP